MASNIVFLPPTFVYFERQTDFTTICGILALKERLSFMEEKLFKLIRITKMLSVHIGLVVFCQLEAIVQQCDCGKHFFYHVL